VALATFSTEACGASRVYHPFMTTKLLLAFVLGLTLLPSTCSPASSPGSPAEIAPATKDPQEQEALRAFLAAKR
jgi:hypothetical protein